MLGRRTIRQAARAQRPKLPTQPSTGARREITTFRLLTIISELMTARHLKFTSTTTAIPTPATDALCATSLCPQVQTSLADSGRTLLREFMALQLLEAEV